ncbi:MAG TPA: hypothetical protein VD886_22925 [Herpetosiphonaceae bacterium]|nr:hypothetical protein [Herpetosiphonaceae bacterium]
MSNDEKRHTFADDPVLKHHTTADQRPGVLEPQPDKMQPDVENLPDMSVHPSGHEDKGAEQAQAEREALNEKLNGE